MTIREKYAALRNAEFVKQMMVTSVYGTMQLEQQEVARNVIEKLYDQVQEERKSKIRK